MGRALEKFFAAQTAGQQQQTEMLAKESEDRCKSVSAGQSACQCRPFPWPSLAWLGLAAALVWSAQRSCGWMALLTRSLRAHRS